MRYFEFYEGISRPDAEKYTDWLKQAIRDIECDEAARHSMSAEEYLRASDINDKNSFYALDDKLERLQKQQLKKIITKKNGNNVSRKDVDAAYDQYKRGQHDILMKHRKRC